MMEKAQINEHGIANAGVYEDPTAFAVSSKRLQKADLESFVKGLTIEVRERDAEKLVFDVNGIEPPLANALRRIMIAEIPSVAVEKVNMWQNTSILPDENLAHRMGLVPILVDPALLEYRQPDQPHDERNCLKFKLHVRCSKKDPNAAAVLNDTANEEQLYHHANVYSRDLKWEPIGNQARLFARNPPRALHPDIMIAKLRPGQEIEMELFCEKGLGRTHAKWSPVCTAFYRLVPHISFTEDILNEEVSLPNLQGQTTQTALPYGSIRH